MLYYLAKYKNITVYKLKGKLSKNKNYYGIMHLKTVLFDHDKILFGSANWSYSAFSKNYELLYIVKDYKIAKKFEHFFEEIKQRSTIFK
jgi:phosphatidylserine/phosphatidylglycerophosphate/cardiolipin synthase-like enzyme